VIVGGGNSAGQAALYLAEHAARCRLIIRGPDLSRSMSQYLIDQLAHHPEIELITHTSSPASTAATSWTRSPCTTTGPDAATRWPSAGCSCSSAPSRAPAGCATRLRPMTRGSCSPVVTSPPPRWPTTTVISRSSLETSQPGVFAVGDVRAGSVKRAASAVGEGSMAVRMIHQRLAHPATLTAPHPDAPPSTPTRVAVSLPAGG
jgi:thioredoxin reductase (NADPH)